MEPDEQLRQSEEAPSETPATGEGGAAEAGPPSATPPEPGEGEGEPPSEQRPQRRRRWLTLALAGVVVLAIVAAAAFFALSRGGNPESPASPGAIGKGLSAGHSLAEYFVPLSTPGEDVLLRVSFALEWPEETRIAFLQEQVAIQDEVYEKLSNMTAKGMIPRKGSALEEDYRLQLEHELTRIFERSLKVQDFKLSLQEVVFLPGGEAKATPEPGAAVEDSSAPP